MPPPSIDWNPYGVWTSPFYGKLIFTLLWKEAASPDKKWDMWKAHIFSNIFRIIGDLWTFNNDKFENNYNNIYPHVSELNNENGNPCKSSF